MLSYVVFQSFFYIQLFPKFVMAQVFQGPGFFGSGSRVQVQGLGPGFRSSRLFRIITYTFCMHTLKRIADLSVKSFEFTAAVRGFHVYRDIWLPYINETLICLHELGNACDVFVIKCIKGNVIVGHLAREISRPTKHLLERGAIVTATITSEHYLLLQRYEQFVKTLYAESKDEVILQK